MTGRELLKLLNDMEADQLDLPFCRPDDDYDESGDYTEVNELKVDKVCYWSCEGNSYSTKEVLTVR